MVRVHHGDWDDVDTDELRRMHRFLRMPSFSVTLLVPLRAIAVFRGDPVLVEGLAADLDHVPDDWAVRVALQTATALIATAAGDTTGAAAAGVEGVEQTFNADQPPDEVLLVLPTTVDALLALGDRDEARRLVEAVAARPQLAVPPLLSAHVEWCRARLDGPEAGLRFAAATEEYDRLLAPFWRARAQLDHAEWLAARGDPATAGDLATAAASIFERLRAHPFLARARALAVPHAVPLTDPTPETAT